MNIREKREANIRLVMNQSACSRDEAINALSICKSDIVNAVIYLFMQEGNCKRSNREGCTESIKKQR